MTDQWHRKLALDLGTAGSPEPAPDDVSEPAAGLDGPTLLEIAFGRARSVVAYALELAVAHRLPATGSVAGDDVWLRLGNARARFTMNRREGLVIVSSGQAADVRARWDEGQRAIALVDADGSPGSIVDLEAMARSAVDGIVAEWRANPSAAMRLSVHPRDHEDEPTKG
ncbi:MAG TPA: hypothetical protein VK762_12985 [Polyangiaceae bacterium]|jgi:hypothetical protein|nr:hypothetical protein [Polyangiaceae bacterium]